ncbi:twin-arginine translocase TatA/TatE family subunit [bacterium]|nr:twin-arginine translocase TatA/TatE family subunit [bacterium]
MEFGRIGLPELLLIFLLIILLFGAKRLPELGKAIGQGLREFKKAISSAGEEEEKEEEKEEKKEEN